MERELLMRDEFRSLWLRRRRVFRLEMSDSYGVEDEAGPFRRWLLGEPDDYAWPASRVRDDDRSDPFRGERLK